MALNATIHKAELQVSDIGRNHYGTYSLTLARHPSETEERLMVRLLAFALHADERLEFGKGLSSDDEPALWRRDLTGRIEEWIDVGLPDERWVRKAAGRAEQVFLYLYGGRSADQWWRQNGGAVARLDNLTVRSLPWESTQALARMATRNLRLTCTVQDELVWVADDGGGSVSVEITTLEAP